MALVKCQGPQGQPGVLYRSPEGVEGVCHTWVDEDVMSMRTALRAAMRDANDDASGGDPRMARDG